MPAASPLPTFADASPLGNIMMLKRDPLGFYDRLAGEVGSFGQFELSTGTYYFVNDPPLVREVLGSGSDAFVKWSFNAAFKLLFRDGILSSEEPLHRRMQRVVRPVLARDRLAGYAEDIVAIARRRLDGWQEGLVDLARELSLLTLEIAGQCLLSVDLGASAEEIYEATRTIQRLSGRHGAAPQENREYDCIVATLYRLVAEIRAESARSGAVEDDLLKLLLAAQDLDPAGVTEERIQEELMTFLLAGHMTIATTLGVACWMLARDPALQAEVHRQVVAAIGDRPPTLADLPALGLCERVFLETMRLYPPVWALGRQSVRPLVLGGQPLPVGARVVICLWTLHRDPQRFPAPESFRPERWENNLRDSLPPGSYVPFSSGPRACLGERFAMLEGPLVLACLAQRWHFTDPAPAAAPAWTPRLILWPRGGVHLQARRHPPT